jgi:hypothetical protein
MIAALQDVREALRTLGRRRAFAVAIILSLALGIGGAATVFTVVDAVLVNALPFRNAERLVYVSGAADPPSGDPLRYWGQCSAFRELASYRLGVATLGQAAAREYVTVSVVSRRFFLALEVSPQIGRTFTERPDTAPGSTQVVVVSYRLWARDLGRSPAAVGREVLLNRFPFTVVGVMPPGFSFPGNTDVWVPRDAPVSALALSSVRSDFSLRPGDMIGRLRVGTSLETARAQLNALLRRLTTLYPGVQFGGSVVAERLYDRVVRNLRPALRAIFAAASFLLLIAWANAVSLFLARSIARRKEMAVRLCLGAGWAQALRLASSECFALALAGGGLGTAIAVVALRIIRAVGPLDMPRLTEARVGVMTVAFSFCLSVVAGLALGLVAGLRGVGRDPAASLRELGEGSAAGRGQRARSALVVGQIGVSLILLGAGTVMVRSFLVLTRVNPGFDPRHAIVASLVLPQGSPPPATPATGKPAARGAPPLRAAPAELRPKRRATAGTSPEWYRLLAYMGSEPGVVVAGLAGQLPLGAGTGGQLFFDADGKLAVGEAVYFLVDGSYFRAMGVPLLRGREFATSDDARAAKVIIVSQAFAGEILRLADPVGRYVTIEGEPYARQIVGLVGNVKSRALNEPPRPEFYLPYSQPYRNFDPPSNLYLVLRTGRRAAGVVPSLRERVQQAAPGATISRVQPMTELIQDWLASRRFRSLLLASFAALGVLLAGLGVYGLVSYTVADRTREIGIRMALGADRRSILMLVLQQGARLALAGTVLGSLGIALLTRAVSGMLFGMSPTEPKTLLASAGFIFVVSLVASLMPAFKATRVRPSDALRHE